MRVRRSSNRRSRSRKAVWDLGLSIARKSALLCRGDIELIEGELGGAAFR
jgi:hypothetical protein